MFARMGIMVALAVAIGAVALGANAREARADEDAFVTINPSSGPSGTVVTAELFDAPPNDFITVIFKIPGDPVLTTGTTDATGYAKFTFTIPYTPFNGTYILFFTDFKCDCQEEVPFTVIGAPLTPTPTNTPPPATATPTNTPTAIPTGTPTVPPTSTPTATPTPGVPILGTNGPMDGPGPNFGILGLGFLAVITVLAWFAATRRGPGTPAMAVAGPAHDNDYGPDYSTELDLATLEALRRPFRGTLTAASAKPRGNGIGWAFGAGVSAVVGLVLLRRR